MTISPQSQKLYKLLLGAAAPLSAKELSSKLNLYPNVIYRLAAPLISMGLIEKAKEYPYQFTAKPIPEGQSLFLLNQNDWFTKQFSTPNQNKNSAIEEVKISFIQNRDEMFNLSVEEINKTNTSVDLLRSGSGIPAEVMLALLNAKKRGVITRMLIQDYTSENANRITYWKQNGILVKKTPLRHIRLMIYDSATLYFMSYRHKDSDKDLGMKVSYRPFATILSKLFNDWWKNAAPINP